jgi:hypothetical protein
MAEKSDEPFERQVGSWATSACPLGRARRLQYCFVPTLSCLLLPTSFPLLLPAPLCGAYQSDGGDNVKPNDGGNVKPDDGGDIKPDDGGDIKPDDGGPRRTTCMMTRTAALCR